MPNSQRGTFTGGQPLPVAERTLTRETIRAYADASGDHNPIHIDPEAAKAAGFPDVIAHGMLLLVYITDFLDAAFNAALRQDGALKLRFRAPAHPGDHLTISGTIRDARQEDSGDQSITCDVELRRQDGTVLVTAQATVALPAQSQA